MKPFEHGNSPNLLNYYLESRDAERNQGGQKINKSLRSFVKVKGHKQQKCGTKTRNVDEVFEFHMSMFVRLSLSLSRGVPRPQAQGLFLSLCRCLVSVRPLVSSVIFLVVYDGTWPLNLLGGRWNVVLSEEIRIKFFFCVSLDPASFNRYIYYECCCYFSASLTCSNARLPNLGSFSSACWRVDKQSRQLQDDRRRL